MNRQVVFALATALLGVTLPLGGAFALLAPQYYEQARREAPIVVVIAITGVTAPEAGFGDCKVAGEVRAVERGAGYKPGQSVVILVPCVKPGGGQPPLGGTIYLPLDTLAKSPFGRAYLDEKGTLMLSQFAPLAALP